MNKIIDFEELKNIRDNFPSRTIVHCHGVFDVLHPGHLSYFSEAKKFGDLLVVTITEDPFVNKGPGRPFFSHQKRAQILAALSIVDFTASSPYPISVTAIEYLRPHYYVKGPDYKDLSKDETGGIYLEKKAVELNGGKLVFK